MAKRMTMKDVEDRDASLKKGDKVVKELIDKYIAGLAEAYDKKIRDILKRKGLLK
jgi:hypothetical protein